MFLHRTLAGLGSLAVTATALVGLSAPATDAAPADTPRDSLGRGPEAQNDAAKRSTARLADTAAETPGADDPLQMPASYPFQPELRLYPDNSPDASDTGQLIGHDDIAPMLSDWMRTSNRISTQVVGQSTQGRDLYLVTVTAPESADETARQTAWRRKVKADPAAAASDAALQAGYKTPVWISANIHGNEWEGTDAAMSYIEDLVEAPWREVSGLLREHRLYFSVSLNPDGRTLGTRATALSLDANRDMITSTTPESVSFVKTARTIQPLYAADLHGYTEVLQVEPCGPPHGENYEYDLFIGHAYAAAERVERDVVAAQIPGNTYYDRATDEAVAENTGHIKIPYRDTPSGWDDYPPVFTAQYAAFHGAVTATVELPLRRPNGSSQTPANAVVNSAVAKQTITSMVDYVADNSGDMLRNQIELFRRGAAGEPKAALTEASIAAVPGPDSWKPFWDVADDQDPVSLPRAYVIPVGDDQRSLSDATDLVDQLLFNGIEVGTLDRAVTVGGTTYPAGSYVVDMHQPLRGLANSLLDLGSDISAKVPSMYDVSAWSYSSLWGADVAKVGATTDAALGATTRVRSARSPSSVPARRGYLAFDVAGVSDYQALNALLEDGVAVSMLEDGVAVIGPEGYDEARAVATELGIRFTAATAEERAALADEGTRDLKDLTIAYTGTQDDKLALTQLGFDDLVPVNAAMITAEPSVLDGTDLLWIGSGLSFTPAQATGRAAVQAYVDAGHSLVGRGAAANSAANAFGLLSATAVVGNAEGNGIVAVDTPADSVLAPYRQDAAFVYPATWFTPLGAGTKVEQRYAADPLQAGHWRAATPTPQNPNAANGPELAAGQASVISGEAASGARSLVFGTSVFFRTHTKGQMSQAARALFWAAPEGDGVAAPSNTAVSVTSSPVRYPADAVLTVRVTSEDGVPTGTVDLVDASGRVVTSAELVRGAATLTVSGLRPGVTSYDVDYTPDAAGFDASSAESVKVRVSKATSRTRLRVGDAPGRRVTATVDVLVPRLSAPTGVVVLTDRGRVVRRVTLTRRDQGSRRVALDLGRGRHVLRAAFRATPLVQGSVSPARVVRR